MNRSGIARAGVTGIGTAVPEVTDVADLLRTEPLTATGDDPVRRLRGRGLRYKDRATKLALCAAQVALTDAGLLVDDELTVPAADVGVVVSTNLGNVDTVCDTVATIAAETYLGTSPMLLPATASNVVASWTAITFGLRGANLTLCNGPTSGLDAVHWARLLVASGRVRHVLVVGVEPANDPVRHLVAGGAPAGPVRVLDGAAALVLESAIAAAERGAAVRAEIGAYARRPTLELAVSGVETTDPRPVGLWLPPAGSDLEPGGPSADLTARFGECSGALGVLQCVAAVSWLDRNNADTKPFGRPEAGDVVLVAAGSGDAGGDDAAAALTLGPALARAEPRPAVTGAGVTR